MTMRTLLVGLLVGGAGSAAAQSAPSFEVASIKPHPEPITFSADAMARGSRVTATASTLLDLITDAYGVRYDQISGGPGWIKSDHYDLAAKAEGEGPITKDQLRQMLQSLLADRFQLKIHRETRETPVYDLVVAKNGPKLKQVSPDADGRMGGVIANSSGMHLTQSKGTMEQLAHWLSGNGAGRPVFDKTGLTGFYAYTLDWVRADRIPDSDSNVPSIFNAVQEQLGLKLESAKGPIKVIIVDRAEKPSEN